MKICIIYDTKRGSTSHIANWIKEGLSGEDEYLIDVKLVKDVTSLNYDLFIIGTPIYWEKPLKGVIDFLTENKEELKGKKVAIFIVCMANLFGHFTEKYIQTHYLAPLKREIEGDIIAEGVFKGWLKKINYNEKENIIRWAKELAKKIREEGSKL